MNRSIIIGAIIISAAILLNGFWERRSRLSDAASGPTNPAVAISDHTIAVVPFTSSNSAEDDISLADGIQREIITRLSAQHVKTTIVQEAPHSGNFLRGNVQRAGNRVRVNVQLVDAVSGNPHWAETYDRELNDVFALESEIAENVAKSVVAKQKT